MARGERSASPGKRSAAAAPKAPRDLSEALNGAFSYLVRARGRQRRAPAN
jgi:hypothetical protein